MSGSDVAADVPGRYDLVVDGYGYVTARSVDPNAPFRVQQEQLNWTPTFLERTNTSAAYGDNQQDFFLTWSQNDWSGGDGQRFVHLTDSTTANLGWQINTLDNTVAGQLTLSRTTDNLSAAYVTVARTPGVLTQTMWAVSATNLFTIGAGGSTANLGAHGAGAQPSVWGLCSDGVDVYMTSTSGGSVGVRKYDTAGVAFSTFSATQADAIAFHNNALYVYTNSTGILASLSTAGAATTVFQFKQADGGADSSRTVSRMISHGGKLLVLLDNMLYQYDGTNFTQIAVFPANFWAGDMCVLDGIVVVGGADMKFVTPGNASLRPSIFTYENGTIEKLWTASGYIDVSFTLFARAAVASFNGGILFTDDSTSRLMFWNPATGAFSSLGSYTVTNNVPGDYVPQIAASSYSAILSRGFATYLYPGFGNVPATTGHVICSLVDFDNSLTKLFRGIKVDYSAGTGGNGGSVDIAYQVDSLDGSYTTLQSSAVSGTEYALTGISGHTISVKITINKGTSTTGPTLKRVYVRGVPVLQSYRMNEFILDLTGTASNPVVRRDLSTQTLTGEQMRVNLTASIQSTSPLTVTDRTGTYTAVFEPANCELDQARPGQWYARVRLREV